MQSRRNAQVNCSIELVFYLEESNRFPGRNYLGKLLEVLTLEFSSAFFQGQGFIGQLASLVVGHTVVDAEELAY